MGESNRLFKDTFVGGTSDANDIEEMVEFLKVLNPRTILDIGTGCFGKLAYVTRQYVEHKYRFYYGNKYLKIDGIEAFEPNYAHVNKLGLYDFLIHDEAIPALKNLTKTLALFPPYDVMVCSHVLEHHSEEDAWELLKLMYSACSKGIILACPDGEYVHEDVVNKYQTHRSTWTPEKISTKYPITTPVYSRNNVGKSQFILVIPR